MGENRGSEWNRWDLHLHTRASYDYKYQSDDAEELLCNSLRKNNIKAVAITDHFFIDRNRIEKLRSLASDIVFFPGVELRTDKGANNLHIILIFSDLLQLDTLANDFDAIMRRQHAKASENPETIHWTLEDIIDFAKNHDGLISIHAGRKSNGIDKEITNAIPVKEAIKTEIASVIDFFEIGQVKDIEDYNMHVFKDIERKPLIMCSDCHDPREYSTKESLWIKGELTFEGLKQCVYQPQERVFIGTIPAMLDRYNKNKQANIDKIEIKRIDSPRHADKMWFDCSLYLNHGMVAIIGNKGSGKSAFSDIVGHLCKSHTMSNASFLTGNRFRKTPQNYANDYSDTITWADGTICSEVLGELDYSMSIEDAQYLPQQYIETVCNDMGDDFQQEINKVIFSYIDYVERGEAKTLEELVRYKTRKIENEMQRLKAELHEQNAYIINLEKKKANAYKTKMENGLDKLNEMLRRHEASKPVEVKAPDKEKSDKENKENLEKIIHDIGENEKIISNKNSELRKIDAMISETDDIINLIESLEKDFTDIDERISEFVAQYGIEEKNFLFRLVTPKEYLRTLYGMAQARRNEIYDFMNNKDSGIQTQLNNLKSKRDRLISSASNEERLYQKYLDDLQTWENKRKEIIGNKNTIDTREYYKYELEFINNSMETEYNQALSKRNEITAELYKKKQEIVSVYHGIYSPIQTEIYKMLGDFEDSISFEAEILMKTYDIIDSILSFINRTFKGKFGRGKNSQQEIDKIIQWTNFSSIEDVRKFIDNIAETATEDFDIASRKIQNLQEFYDFLYGIDYLGVDFKLKMGDRSLSELSPGERGIVLLIFYLALSKESKPIIIDQPEDNLDNQSVYGKLVPCIQKAKQRRQVIIVTHNPNIAIACDAEQIIYSRMEKNTCQIQYESGAIENTKIKKHVVDVLEGTMPAFDLRRKKYN